MQEEVINSLAARRGHFLLESGHHGDRWLDLELLCLQPAIVHRFAGELASRLAKHNIEAVCGPLVEGAFIGLMVAAELEIDFSYSERFTPVRNGILYPVEYRIPGALRSAVCGKRVAIVNDVINAGSAVRGTFSDLQAIGARPVAIGSLLVLGNLAAAFATERELPLENIAWLDNVLWTPPECPQCASGTPLEDVAGFTLVSPSMPPNSLRK